MKLNPQTFLLENILFRESPNYDLRPANTDINLLVIHNISLPPNEFGTSDVDSLFMNTLNCNTHPSYDSLKNLQVSSHLFLRREGEFIQYVPFDKRAWHAGVSQFQGRENCNDFSIGIELEGADNIPYTMAQYKQLADVTRLLICHFPAITQDRIVGHSDIAPERKTDPGQAFDWRYYKELL